MSKQAVLCGERLYKAYGKRPVLRDVSIEVSGGEVVGLLGPNGAGKTTTFSIIVGILRPDKGNVRYNGCLLYTSPSPRD